MRKDSGEVVQSMYLFIPDQIDSTRTDVFTELQFTSFQRKNN